MQPNESHRAVLPVKEFEEAYVFFATKNGTVKKTPMVAFSRPRSSGIIAITLDPDDSLINVERTTGENEIVLGSRGGMAVRFDETNVRAMGRGARGVKGMTLTGDDVVVSMVATNLGDSVLSICENGYGKRTNIDEYRKTKRGGKGVINIKTTERNGGVVAIRAVQDDDELMIITANGIMLRTDLSAVRVIGRATQGVRLIRLDENDLVVAVAKIASEVEPNGGETLADDPKATTEPDPEPGAENAAS
jgi:DNA gyrase subunit A